MNFLRLIALGYLMLFSAMGLSAENKITVEKISFDQKDSLYSVGVTIPLNEALSLIELEESAAKIAKQEVLKEVGQFLTHETKIINDQIIQDKITGFRYVVSKIDRQKRTFNDQSLEYTFNVHVDKSKSVEEGLASSSEKIKIINVNQELKDRVIALEEEKRRLLNNDNTVRQELDITEDIPLPTSYKFQNKNTATTVKLLMKNFDIKGVEREFDETIVTLSMIPREQLIAAYPEEKIFLNSEQKGRKRYFHHANSINSISSWWIYMFKNNIEAGSAYIEVKEGSFNNETTRQSIASSSINDLKGDALLFRYCIENKCQKYSTLGVFFKDHHPKANVDAIEVSVSMVNEKLLRIKTESETKKDLDLRLEFMLCPIKRKMHSYECDIFLTREINAKY